jgi:endonuclease III
VPREARAVKAARAREILARLRRAYPESQISLNYGNEFQLAVAVVLSAQCTDAMVNRVTRGLFPRYPDVDAFAQAHVDELAQAIRSTGYYRQKARNIVALARTVRDRHGGRLPRTLDALVALPGIGRKTANVILWNAFGLREGIAVDTHVQRVTRLLRLTSHQTPPHVERDLMDLVPRQAWGDLTHLVIDHGRAVCVARRPRCEQCVLNDLCPSARRPPNPAVLADRPRERTRAGTRIPPSSS